MARAEVLASQFDDVAQQRAAASLGMWVFLATEMLFFGAPLLVYLIGRFEHAAAFSTGSHRLETALGVVNTAVLLTSSLAMAYADEAAERGRARLAASCLAVTALLGVVFLLIKAHEYKTEYAEGLLAFSPLHAPAASGGEQLFFNVYLFLTGLHALHLAIGIGAVLAAAAAFAVPRPREARAAQVRITALYWHFVDVVWIFLLPLLYLVK